MPLQGYQLNNNALVTVGGSNGYVAQTDNHLTAVVREDGTADWYSTEYILAEGELVQSEEQQQVAETDAQRIASLEEENRLLREAQQPPPGPAAVSTPGTVVPTGENGANTEPTSVEPTSTDANPRTQE